MKYLNKQQLGPHQQATLPLWLVHTLQIQIDSKNPTEAVPADPDPSPQDTKSQKNKNQVTMHLTWMFQYLVHQSKDNATHCNCPY